MVEDLLLPLGKVLGQPVFEQAGHGVRKAKDDITCFPGSGAGRGRDDRCNFMIGEAGDNGGSHYTDGNSG